MCHTAHYVVQYISCAIYFCFSLTAKYRDVEPRGTECEQDGLHRCDRLNRAQGWCVLSTALAAAWSQAGRSEVSTELRSRSGPQVFVIVNSPTTGGIRGISGTEGMVGIRGIVRTGDVLLGVLCMWLEADEWHTWSSEKDSRAAPFEWKLWTMMYCVIVVSESIVWLCPLWVHWHTIEPVKHWDMLEGDRNDLSGSRRKWAEWLATSHKIVKPGQQCKNFRSDTWNYNRYLGSAT